MKIHSNSDKNFYPNSVIANQTCLFKHDPILYHSIEMKKEQREYDKTHLQVGFVYSLRGTNSTPLQAISCHNVN